MRLGTSTTGRAGDCVLDAAVDYAALASMTLAAQGENVVCVQFIGGDGRTTDILTAAILYDGGAPYAASLSVNGGADFVTAQGGGVNLSISAFDELTRVAHMKIANTTTGDCATALDGVDEEPFVTVKSWIVNNPQNAATGPRTVCASFADAAGNWSSPVSDTVYFDPVLYAPGLLARVRGAEARTDRTRNARVTVELAFTGAVTDITQVLVANDASFSGAAWRPFSAAITCSLVGGEGLKPLFVNVRVFAANQSDRLQPQITLDQTPPAVPGLSLADNNGDGFALGTTEVELAWTKPSDSDLAGYQLEKYVDGVSAGFLTVSAFGANELNFTDWVTTTTGRTLYYRILAYDDLGNASGYSIILPARPFQPIDKALVLRSDTGTTYSFAPSSGVFLVTNSGFYETGTPGVPQTESLGFNLLSYTRDAAASRFNDGLVLRTANQDNTLVYDTTLPFGIDQRGFDGASYSAQSGMGIGVDTSGAVHIGFHAVGAGYATNKSGNWQLTTLSSSFEAGAGTRAAISPEGSAHMTYFFDIAPGAPAYQTNRSGSWQFEGIGNSDPANEAAIAASAGNTPHIVYPTWFSEMRYAVRGSAGWVNTVIESVSGTYPDVATNAGTLCATYWVPSVTTVRLACKTGAAAFNLSDVVNIAGVSATAVAVKPDQTPVVFYTVSGTLKVWTPSSTATIAADGKTPDAAVDRFGNAYVVYVSGSYPNKKLEFATDASGTWKSRTLVSVSSVADSPSITVDAAGFVHIAYADQIKSELGYIRLEPQLVADIAPGLVQGAVAVGSDGTLHIAAYGKAEQALYYLTVDGQGVTAVKVDDDASTDLGQNPAIVLGPGDKAHIAYSDATNGQVKYATNQGGAWQTEPLGAGGFAQAITRQANGTIHIASGGIYYVGAFGSWQSETVPSAYDGPQAIAVAADGTVHLATSPGGTAGSSWFKYQKGGLGNWTTRLSPYIGTVPSLPGIAVDAGGHVHVVCEEEGDLAYYTDQSGSLVRSVIDSQGTVGYTATLQMDAAGHLHVTYYDGSNARWKYATNRYGAWLTMSLLGSPSYNGRLAISAAGTPVFLFDDNASLLLVNDFIKTVALTGIVRTTAF
jgi:hypothetical protein